MRRFSHSAMLVMLALAPSLGAQVTGPEGARIDSALRALQPGGFSGVVRVERDGQPILAKGYGLANREAGIPFTPNTVVQIGSNTKDFTNVALLQLYEKGRLSFTDSIGKYFRHVPDDKRGITLNQLVHHTAGFPIGLGEDFDRITRAGLIHAAMTRPLLFTPGSREQYSNTGYSLLAAIVEQVSGLSYDRYVERNILKPLGLKDTGFLLPKFDARRLAHGYRGGVDQGTITAKPHAADGPYWNLRGNGGMLSTLGDMQKFYRSLFEGSELLKPATAQIRFPRDQPIGLAGSDLVFFFLYERDPIAHVEFFIATNSAEVPDRQVRTAIAEVLGLPTGNAVRVVQDAGPRKNAKAPTEAVATMLHAFLAAVNSGDSTQIHRFIGDNFEIAAGSNPIEARVQRMVGMHGNLGDLKFSGLDQLEPNTVEMSVISEKQGAVTMRLSLNGGSPARIIGVQVMVGG